MHHTSEITFSILSNDNQYKAQITTDKWEDGTIEYTIEILEKTPGKFWNVYMTDFVFEEGVCPYGYLGHMLRSRKLHTKFPPIVAD